MADSVDQSDGLGLALVERRGQLGISRPDLARMSQLSYPYVYEIEKGRKSPSADALESLAAALELTPSDLVERARTQVTGTGPELELEPADKLALVGQLSADPLDELTDRVMEKIRPLIRSAIADASRSRE